MAGICRQLDGIPLAIELTASRASTYGIRGLVRLIDLKDVLAEISFPVRQLRYLRPWHGDEVVWHSGMNPQFGRHAA